jgi:hypothetical protein
MNPYEVREATGATRRFRFVKLENAIGIGSFLFAIPSIVYGCYLIGSNIDFDPASRSIPKCGTGAAIGFLFMLVFPLPLAAIGGTFGWGFNYSYRASKSTKSELPCRPKE